MPNQMFAVPQAREAAAIEHDGPNASLSLSWGLEEEMKVDPYSTAMVWVQFITAEALKNDGLMNATERDQLLDLYKATRT